MAGENGNGNGGGRGPGGLFAKGNPGGPGRPKRSIEETYLTALREIASIERWNAIVEMALVQAEQGDRYAREWLSRYLLPLRPDVALPEGATVTFRRGSPPSADDSRADA